MTPLEKDIEKKLVGVVKRHGGLCLKWVCPGWSGVPDRIILLPGGRVLFAELKRPKGSKVSALQTWWRETLKRLGFTVWHIYDHDQLKYVDFLLADEIARKTPHNKGEHTGSYPGMVATQFKKGHTPKNHRPVGSERTTRDGYLERKIAEPNVWRQVHVLNWEAVNGPVPKGRALIFKNGDKTNPDVSNLLLVTRAELARMNQKGLISADPEQTEVGQNIARLILATAKRKKERKRRTKS